jgi:hypothetical protein
MARCSAIKADGNRCKVEAMPEAEWCWNHHPAYEEARQRRASKGGKRGGRGRPQAELAALKARLSDLAEAVLAGEVDKGAAAVAGQLLNTVIRAVSVEMKVREQEEILQRIETLEQAREGGSRWGA